jgi:hypothetical protein
VKLRLYWMWAVLKGLGNASTSDVSVFLLALVGILLGGRRGLGKALLTYVLLHRADQYGHLYASKMDRIAQVIRENQPSVVGHPLTPIDPNPFGHE